MNVDFDALRDELGARAAYAAELRRTHESGGDEAGAERGALALEHLEAQLERVRTERERSDARYAERIAALEQGIATLRARADDAQNEPPATDESNGADAAPRPVRKRKKTPKRG